MTRATTLPVLVMAGTAMVASCSDAAETLRDHAAKRGLLVGAAVHSELLLEEPAYAAIAGSEFSSITPENDLKWQAVEPAHGEFTWAGADAIADFARAHHQTLRGHTLIWANSYSDGLFGILPVYVASASDAATMQMYLDDHVEAVVSRYADVTTRWDVVNEPLATFDSVVDENVLTTALGETWMVRAFQLAHTLDPDARLYVNEALIEGPGPRLDALIALVQRLRAAGAPIHGVGLQSHFLFGAPPAPEFEAAMRALGSAGLEVAITELDIATLDGDLDAQAFDYANVFGSCLAVDACVEVTMWGVTDAHSWLNSFLTPTARPLLFDADALPKPAYRAVVARLRAPEGSGH